MLFSENQKDKAREVLEKTLEIVRLKRLEDKILAYEFFRYILYSDNEIEWKKSKKIVKSYIKRNIKLSNFDFGKLIEKVKKDGHPDGKNIEKIAKKILKRGYF